MITLVAQELKKLASRPEAGLVVCGEPGHGIAHRKLKVVQSGQTFPKIAFGAGYLPSDLFSRVTVSCQDRCIRLHPLPRDEVRQGGEAVGRRLRNGNE